MIIIMMKQDACRYVLYVCMYVHAYGYGYTYNQATKDPKGKRNRIYKQFPPPSLEYQHEKGGWIERLI